MSVETRYAEALLFSLPDFDEADEAGSRLAEASELFEDKEVNYFLQNPAVSKEEKNECSMKLLMAY